MYDTKNKTKKDYKKLLNPVALSVIIRENYSVPLISNLKII